MDFNELLEKYEALLIENNILKEEIKCFNVQPGYDELQDVDNQNHLLISEKEESKPEIPNVGIYDSAITINKKSDSIEKIKLFMSLFRGRDDVSCDLKAKILHSN